MKLKPNLFCISSYNFMIPADGNKRMKEQSFVVSGNILGFQNFFLLKVAVISNLDIHTTNILSINLSLSTSQLLNRSAV